MPQANTQKSLKRLAKRNGLKVRKKLKAQYTSPAIKVRGAMRKNRLKTAVKMIFGAVLVFFFAPTSLILVFDEEREIDPLMIAMLGGIALLGLRFIVKGAKDQRLNKQYPRYKQALAEGPVCRVEDFAGRLNKKPKATKKKLLVMMKLGFFPDAYMNIKTGEIRSLQADAEARKETTEADEMLEYIVVPCPYCQTENRIRDGAIGSCTCCGASI